MEVSWIVQVGSDVVDTVVFFITGFVSLLNAVLDMNFRLVSVVLHTAIGVVEFLLGLAVVAWQCVACLIVDFLTFSEDVAVVISNVGAMVSERLRTMALNSAEFFFKMYVALEWLKETTGLAADKTVRTVAWFVQMTRNLLVLLFGSLLLFFQSIPELAFFLVHGLFFLCCYVLRWVWGLIVTVCFGLLNATIGIGCLFKDAVVHFPLGALCGFLVMIGLWKAAVKCRPHFRRWINEIRRRRRRRLPPPSLPPPRPPVKSSPAPSEEQRDALQCIICHERQRSIILMPCRHVCMCDTCTYVLLEQNHTCPVCRTVIIDALNVYF